MNNNNLNSLIPAHIQIVSKEIIEAQKEESLVIAMEECCELSQAISKLYRNKDYYDNMCEEIADALIAIGIAIQYGEIKEEDILKWSNFKIKRFRERRDSENL